MEQTKSKYQKIVDIIALVIASGLCIFQLYSASFGTWSSFVLSAVHWGVIGSYIILRNPTKLKGAGPVIDWLMIAATVFICIYQIQMQERMVMSAGFYTNMDVVVGIVAILLVLEIGRRSVGKILPIICILFLGYCYFGHYVPGLLKTARFAVKRIAVFIYTSSDGLFGQTLYVSAKYIFLFILFGSILELTGAGKWFVDLAYAAVGKSRGGPAQAAVYSSMLMGTINGSGAANVVTTGTFTIPLMKKIGLKPSTAGAVEAVASSGGQIMPPIMGAAAFLMAEMVGVQYGEIAMRAIFPALLYFTGIFITVHLEAKRLGLKGIPKDELPKFGPLFLRQGYLLIPLVALVAMVMMGYTMSRAAIIATALAILVSMPNKETRMNPTRFINALEAGGKNTLSVAVACGVAGIIAGVVTMTGLGQLLISAIVGVAGDRVIVALFLTMLTCIVLGMGVPTTANYIIMATTCAPILVNGMGINKIAANMFVFYFGIVADITPPVALAAYAGSAIAKSNPMKTALNASRLAIAAFIVPYIFAFNPAMLFIDTGVLGVVTIIITSLIGLFGVAAGLEGYMFANLNVIERLLSIVGGLCLIIPGTVTDLVGIVLVGISAALQMMKKKKAAVA